MATPKYVWLPTTLCSHFAHNGKFFSPTLYTYPMTTATQNHTEGTTAPDLTTTAGKLADLRSRLAETNAPMGQAAIERSHDAGKNTARERIED